MAHKLLLADDSLTIQKVVELVLANEDFEIKTTNDGESALRIIETFAPDIVLADIDMPKLNGYQLCEKIKNNMAFANTPVILLAGAFEPFDEEYAKSVFADDFIIKPFESQELISKVKALLAKVVPPQEPAYEEPTAPEPASDFSDEFSAALEEKILPHEEPTEEPKWDEDIPVAAEKEEEEPPVMVEEEYESKTGLSETQAGFEETLSAAMEREEVSVQPVNAEDIKGSLQLPSNEEVLGVIRQAVNERISETISSEMSSYLAAAINDSVKQTISDIAPTIVADLTRELMKDVMGSIRSEIDTVIRKAVPEVAETIIRKEIEKITAEL